MKQYDYEEGHDYKGPDHRGPDYKKGDLVLWARGTPQQDLGIILEPVPNFTDYKENYIKVYWFGDKRVTSAWASSRDIEIIDTSK